MNLVVLNTNKIPLARTPFKPGASLNMWRGKGHPYLSVVVEVGYSKWWKDLEIDVISWCLKEI
jgi:hypothetical protein